MLCWRSRHAQRERQEVCEGVEFRVSLIVPDCPGLGVVGCEFVVFGFRIWFQVVQSAPCRGMSLVLRVEGGVSG